MIPVQSRTAWYLAVAQKENKSLILHCKIDTNKETISDLLNDLFWFLGGVLRWSMPIAKANKHTVASLDTDNFIAEPLLICVWAQDADSETSRPIDSTAVEEVETTLRSILDGGESD
jgi:hypothetical protein